MKWLDSPLVTIACGIMVIIDIRAGLLFPAAILTVAVLIRTAVHLWAKSSGY